MIPFGTDCVKWRGVYQPTAADIVDGGDPIEMGLQHIAVKFKADHPDRPPREECHYKVIVQPLGSGGDPANVMGTLGVRIHWPKDDEIRRTHKHPVYSNTRLAQMRAEHSGPFVPHYWGELFADYVWGPVE